MKRWNILITGFGNVGLQVAEMLAKRQATYREKYQADVRLIGVSRSTGGLYHEEGLSLEDWRAFAKSAGLGQADVNQLSSFSPSHTGPDFITNSNAQIIIETSPTNFQTGEPGLGYISTALQSGKHAIAISKGALVLNYPELAQLAQESGVTLKISGATAAALPTIDLLQVNTAGCTHLEMTGIVTGTTNYMLTAMFEEGYSYEQALLQAQQLGIAEPDPTFDTDGWDSACKMVILANAGFGAKITLADVKRSGIREIDVSQILAWKEAGLVPKLVGKITRKTNQSDHEIEVTVSLELFPKDHPFAQVKGTTKAVKLTTDDMGELMVIGGGSDPKATAAAALKDFEHILGAE
ncbi:homoserine dehydrogenase [Brevibacillus daliensis]|uniref:homoserine dehydrogenase n=1 Tax=Brevibacillus daliensis TaxID=2892995 RepID=UPI001E5905C0|nr:homoserine dehydrogenase [Brevibacillus daliensis]